MFKITLTPFGNITFHHLDKNEKIKLFSFIIFMLFQFNYSNATISTKIVANVETKLLPRMNLKIKLELSYF